VGLSLISGNCRGKEIVRCRIKGLKRDVKAVKWMISRGTNPYATRGSERENAQRLWIGNTENGYDVFSIEEGNFNWSEDGGSQGPRRGRKEVPFSRTYEQWRESLL